MINYQEALKNAAQSMVRVKDPASLVRMITRFLDKEVGVSHASVLVRNPLKEGFVFCDSKGVKSLPVNLFKLDNENALIKWFLGKHKKGNLGRDYLSLHDIQQALGDSKNIVSALAKEQLNDILGHMKTFKAVLCVPGYFKGELLGILLLGDKKDDEAFTQDDIAFFQTLASDVSMTIKNADYHNQLEEKVKELEHSIVEIQRMRDIEKDKVLQTIITFARMLDARDPYTYGHCESVEKWGMATARKLELDLSENKGTVLSTSFLLHDVGKLGIPDKILNKKGPLTDEEWVLMKDHSRIGAEILATHDDFKDASVIIMHHHENYDGTGYPYKLKGGEIPLQSRIISVVDAFHAMISDRPYRNGLPYDYAIAELYKCSGTQFDPHIVDAFISVLDEEIQVEKT